MAQMFNWAFIGTGTLAKTVANQITKSGRHNIVSVYSRNFEKCSAFAEQYGAVAARSAGEAMSMANVDAVYIVTPHTSHYEYARQAILMSKPVLCEKPMSTDADKVAELIALSREQGVYLAEAMWTWFSPVANKVKEWVDNGEYGDITDVRMTYHMNSVNYAPRVSDPNLGGGALLDIGIYPITYIYRLFGRPENVICSGKLENGIDTGEDIILEYPGGKRFIISTSITDFRGFEIMRIKGTKGRTDLLLYHGANGVKLRRKNGRNEKFKGNGNYLNEFEIVAAEIRAGLTESNYVPLSATLDIMKIMDDCRRQMGLVYPFEID